MKKMKSVRFRDNTELKKRQRPVERVEVSQEELRDAVCRARKNENNWYRVFDEFDGNYGEYIDRVR